MIHILHLFSFTFIALTSLSFDSKILKLAPGRPKCNSILHLFGEWLFQAAFINTDYTQRSYSLHLSVSDFVSKFF